MVLRLSELLERIRPAGTPGAPTEGELQRRDDRRAAEIETITAILTSFETEADAIIATDARAALLGTFYGTHLPVDAGRPAAAVMQSRPPCGS